jgi:hypothetical protein
VCGDEKSSPTLQICPEELNRKRGRLKDVMMAKGIAFSLMYQDARVLMRQLFLGHNDAVTNELSRARSLQLKGLEYSVKIFTRSDIRM